LLNKNNFFRYFNKSNIIDLMCQFIVFADG
jgi:hypothetical protein